MRWWNPVLFIGAALFVRHYNATHTDSLLLFPGMGLLAGPDVHAQGQMTWQVFLGLGGMFAVGAVVGWYRDLRRQPKPQ